MDFHTDPRGLTEAGPSEPLRILLVEDEALIALETRDMLENAGYKVVAYTDRLDGALAAAASEVLDGAVLDVNLAGVAVWPVAEVLRQRGVPFIFLTGLFSGSDLPASCAKAPLLSKPVMPSALIDTLAAEFEKHRFNDTAKGA